MNNLTSLVGSQGGREAAGRASTSTVADGSSTVGSSVVHSDPFGYTTFLSQIVDDNTTAYYNTRADAAAQ